MVKCGKGCMPECEYFTTGGCISPFNCPYKIETEYINTATSVIGSYTQGKDDLNEPKIKKWFRSLVDEGKIQQEPMNYDAATLQIYIDHLEKENAALRARLEKAVELPCKVGDRFYIVEYYPPEIIEEECCDFSFREFPKILLENGCDCTYELGDNGSYFVTFDKNEAKKVFEKLKKEQRND